MITSIFEPCKNGTKKHQHFFFKKNTNIKQLTDNFQVTFKANSDDDFPDEDEDDNEWSDAEIIRVANCVDLEVSLTSNQGWPKDMGSKMMIFENIEELRISTFDLGKANSDSVNKFISKGEFSAGYTRPNKILILGRSWLSVLPDCNCQLESGNTDNQLPPNTIIFVCTRLFYCLPKLCHPYFH